MVLMSDIAKNIAAIRGRLRPDTLLVAVIKNVPTEQVEEAIRAGITDIGENRVQEAEARIPYLKDKYPHIKVHMIGHLQTNKVKKVLPMLDMVQSVDSLRLAEEIDKRADRPVEALIEVNTSGETTKYGILPENALELINSISSLPNIRIKGLMTIAVFSEDPGKVRPCFVRLREIKDQIIASQIEDVEMCYLSMGMSDDYEIAIEEGSNVVRVGRAIFGSRRK